MEHANAMCGRDVEFLASTWQYVDKPPGFGGLKNS
jgi:hypothetical protein